MLTEDLKLFLAAAESGSLSAGARLTRTNPSTVSRRISALEDELGVKLVSRTTRHFSLTDAGRTFKEGAKRIIHDVEELREGLLDGDTEPSGLLRISASVVFGGRYIVPLLGEFRVGCPNVRVDLRLEDSLADLNAGEVDVAVRVGTVPDSQLRHVLLAPLHRIACASPEYLNRRGRPAEPQELSGHDCIVVGSAGRRAGAWRFKGSRAPSFEPAIVVTSHEAAASAARAGGGVAHLPTWLVASELRDGGLERILRPFEETSLGGVHLLWQDRPSARVRAFVDLVRQRIKPGDFATFG